MALPDYMILSVVKAINDLPLAPPRTVGGIAVTQRVQNQPRPHSHAGLHRKSPLPELLHP